MNMLSFDGSHGRTLEMANSSEVAGAIAMAQSRMEFLFNIMNGATGVPSQMIEDFNSGVYGDLILYASTSKTDVTDTRNKIHNAVKNSLNRYNKKKTSELYILTGEVSITTSGNRVIFHFANNKRQLPD